ncbi:MAG TPA: hypothetical protein VGY58_21650 [Gemmataceae bacterium]|jgi:hypothetical protein|nr:hypothetical protein [Gemmataceae bacterium]
MSFTVIWKPEAENRLASLWMNAHDRKAITAAAHEIDQTLRVEAETCGESRPNGRRILIAVPLGVIYRVEPLDRVVHVITVWEIEKH